MKPLVLFVLLYACASAASGQSSDLLISDDFSDNSNNWATNTSGSSIYTISNGKYVLENFDGKDRWVGLHVKLDSHSDYIIGVTTTHVSGVKNTGYGILFGCKDNDNYYVFDIAPTGYYRLYSKTNGTLNYLINWTQSSAVKQNDNEDNIIKVQRYSGTWYFYVNGSQVTSFTPQEFFGDIIGFLKWGTQRIEFDNFTIHGSRSSGSGASPSDAISTISAALGDKSKSSYAGSASSISFIDDFSTSKDEWGEDDDDGILLNRPYSLISDGRLVLRSYKDSTIDRGMGAYLDTKKTFAISADFKRMYGKTANATCGISLESPDGKTGYAFYISANGYYAIKELQSDGTTTGEWKECAYINKGDGVVNNIKIDSDGSYWSLYVNGRYAGLISSHSIYHPNIFLISIDDQRIECDNFKLTGSTNR